MNRVVHPQMYTPPPMLPDYKGKNINDGGRTCRGHLNQAIEDNITRKETRGHYCLPIGHTEKGIVDFCNFLAKTV